MKSDLKRAMIAAVAVVASMALLAPIAQGRQPLSDAKATPVYGDGTILQLGSGKNEIVVGRAEASTDPSGSHSKVTVARVGRTNVLSRESQAGRPRGKWTGTLAGAGGVIDAANDLTCPRGAFRFKGTCVALLYVRASEGGSPGFSSAQATFLPVHVEHRGGFVSVAPASADSAQFSIFCTSGGFAAIVLISNFDPPLVVPLGAEDKRASCT